MKSLPPIANVPTRRCVYVRKIMVEGRARCIDLDNRSGVQPRLWSRSPLLANRLPAHASNSCGRMVAHVGDAPLQMLRDTKGGLGRFRIETHGEVVVTAED